jgi:NAD(P)-dependent dehydrogenase (short-subunit alcohol dehydrogenase family)
MTQTNLTEGLAVENLFSVAGKVALVTGGGSGIGKMIATALARNGARVYIIGRHRAQLSEACSEIRAHGECEAIVADITHTENVEKIAQELAEREGKLNILVNNAGVRISSGIMELSEDAWDATNSVNLRALFFLSQKLIPLLAAGSTEHCWSRIINVSSIGAQITYSSDAAAYSASKAAVENLTRVFARGLGGHRITANAIAPGWFTSRLNEHYPRQFRDEWIENTPVRRIGDIGDMAGAALFLASAASSYVNGQTITLDGGRTL